MSESIVNLTKRETLAAMAMQGLCAERHCGDTQGHPGYIASLAVQCADALSLALAKPLLADDRLMVAATDLSEAAKRILEHYSVALPDHMVEELRSAVAQAEGLS